MMSGSGRKKARRAGEAYTFLVLPPLLSVVPWQCMPVFQEALISRIPSISILKALLVKHEKVCFIYLFLPHHFTNHFRYRSRLTLEGRTMY